MSRAEEMPKWVVGDVLNICRGYDMRASYMAKHNNKDNKTFRVYANYNRAIDQAIEQVCEGAHEAAVMRLCLIDDMTWERITACSVPRRRFYDMRKQVVERIARKLRLY